jgi:DNA-binding protein H-NS
MARPSNIEKMSYAELTAMEREIERLKIEKQNEEREELRKKVTAMVKEAGFDINDLFGRGRKGKGSVAAKYRDPNNPGNTWTGRGRMPRWMAQATKGGKSHRDDFLIK